jgi:peptide/nickel transport system substrate-binding protein
MQRARWCQTFAFTTAVVLLLGACAPQATAPNTGPMPAEQKASAPKILTVGMLIEPATIEGFTGEGGTAGRAGITRYFLHDHLTIQDDHEAVRPQLAVEVPSVEKGTWRVNADGTMDMTWTLRDGVRWHAVAPFTSTDLLFSFTLHKDPDLAHAYPAERRLMESASAPDPKTFIVHWSSVLVEADQARALTPMPRHLLEELYQTDKAAFLNSTRFTSDFVGLGPYRLTKWEPGSHMELARFDDYYQGRPPLDGMTVRFILNSNTMVANALAGAVDVLTPPTIDTDAAFDLRHRWEGTGNTVRIETVSRFVYGELQFRSEFTRPANALINRTVREALYRAFNRAGYAEVMSLGLAPIADSWFWPADALRPEVESAIPQYPYDPGRAQQLLTQAGWVRGADGILAQQATGDRFETEVWVIPQTDPRAATLVAADWKAIGIDASAYAIPPARSDDRQHRTEFPIIEMSGVFTDSIPDRFNGRDLASAANRWSGRNRGGYQNARVDEILDRLHTTIDPRTQITLRREHVEQLMGDVALMPAYWEVQPVVMARDVKADISPTNAGWNVFQWDKTSS